MLVAVVVEPLGAGSVSLAEPKVGTAWSDSFGDWVLVSFPVSSALVLRVRVQVDDGEVLERDVDVRPADEFDQAVILVALGVELLSVELKPRLLDLDGDKLFSGVQRGVSQRHLPLPFGAVRGVEALALVKTAGVYRTVADVPEDVYESAEVVFLGGRRYQLSVDEAEDLVAAGYSEWLTVFSDEDGFGQGVFNSGVWGA